jgi:hypothetical protein
MEILMLGSLMGIGIIAIVMLIIISFSPSKKQVQPENDPVYSVITKETFADKLTKMEVGHMMCLIDMANSLYVDIEGKTEAREELMAAESELLYRASVDLLTQDEIRLVKLYFDNPQTFKNKVKFSLVKS